MFSKQHRYHCALLKTSKFSHPTGTLSPDTMTTTSSGYSTGDSTISTTIIPLSKKRLSLITCNQQKTKPKGFHHFVTKLKNFVFVPKKKVVHSTTTTREMPLTHTSDPYSTTYDLPSSSSQTTSNTISIPLTYYQNAPIKSKYYDKQNHTAYATKVNNFEKISAWLNQTDKLTRSTLHDGNELLYIDETQEQSISSTPFEFHYPVIMKKTSSDIKTPKRSASLVATLNRPVIERHQCERIVSPASSFSSSILTKGMFERMTPQQLSHQSRVNLTDEQNQTSLAKLNRRRAIDFSRRRTVAGSIEQTNNSHTNKENVPVDRRQQIYQFSPATSSNNNNSTATKAKTYYFHPKPPVKNDDILMNSYGLALLQQQPKRPSVSSIVIPAKLPETSSVYSFPKQQSRRCSVNVIQQQMTSDSLDDLLCDREVESYFYPNKRQSPGSVQRHVYLNVESSPAYCLPPPAPYIHGTLC